MSEPCSTFREWLQGACVTVAGIAVYTVALIWQSFDITDEGFHLSNQFWIIHDGANYQYGLTWLSDFLGGFWLQCASHLGLIGARLGWVVTIIATGFVSYAILTSCFRPMPSALCVVGAAFVIPYRGIMIINQNNISFFILLCAAGCMLAAQRLESYSVRSIIYAASGGIFLGLSIMARFPLILAVILPFVAPSVGYMVTKQRQLPQWILAGISISVGVVTIIVCAVLLHVTGHLEGYLKSLAGGSRGEVYSSTNLFQRYWTDAETMVGKTVILLSAIGLFGFFARYLAARFGINRWTPVLFGIITVGFTALGVGILSMNFAYATYTLILPGVCLSAGCFCFVCLWRTSSQSKQKLFQLEVLVVGGVIAVLIMLGSSNGLTNIHHGLWLVLPALCMLMPEALEKISLLISRKGTAKSFRPHVIAGVLVLVLCSAGFRFVNTYRDLSNRFLLTTQFEDPRLRGIFSSKARVQSFEDFMVELDQRCEPGDPLLAFNSMPMAHYLTETKPLLSNPWPVLINQKSLEEQLTQIGSQRPIPSVVVRAKTDPRNRNWGNFGKVYTPSKSVQDKLKLIDDMIYELGYREVWSNQDFVILEKR